MTRVHHPATERNPRKHQSRDQASARKFRAADGILREHIERELLRGDTPDEVRASARHARQVFHLPVVDGDLDRLLWDAVMELRPELMPEPGELEASE